MLAFLSLALLHSFLLAEGMVAMVQAMRVPQDLVWQSPVAPSFLATPIAATSTSTTRSSSPAARQPLSVLPELASVKIESKPSLELEGGGLFVTTPPQQQESHHRRRRRPFSLLSEAFQQSQSQSQSQSQQQSQQDHPIAGDQVDGDQVDVGGTVRPRRRQGTFETSALCQGSSSSPWNLDTRMPPPPPPPAQLADSLEWMGAAQDGDACTAMSPDSLDSTEMQRDSHRHAAIEEDEIGDFGKDILVEDDDWEALLGSTPPFSASLELFPQRREFSPPIAIPKQKFTSEYLTRYHELVRKRIQAAEELREWERPMDLQEDFDDSPFADSDIQGEAVEHEQEPLTAPVANRVWNNQHKQELLLFQVEQLAHDPHTFLVSSHLRNPSLRFGHHYGLGQVQFFAYTRLDGVLVFVSQRIALRVEEDTKRLDMQELFPLCAQHGPDVRLKVVLLSSQGLGELKLVELLVEDWCRPVVRGPYRW